MDTLAWIAATSGFLLGGMLAVVPGFPGCAVSLLGVVAYAALTDFRTLPHEALAVGALVTLVGAVGQLAAPVVTSRAMGGAAGVATGASVGAALGALIPMPGAAWVLALVAGSLLGLLGWRDGLGRWLRGVVGVAGGCVTGAMVDLMATLALGALVGSADFLSDWASLS